MDQVAARARPHPLAGLLHPRVLDRAEQVAILAMWAWFVWRMVQAPNAFAPLIIVSETAVMVFTLIRRPTDAISTRSGDWMLAFTATMTPLMIVAAKEPWEFLMPAGAFLLIVGNFTQAWAKLVLRRSFGIAPANRGVKVNGPYRYVRHPMYAGYLMVHVGVLAVMFTPLNLAIYTVAWIAQILRILAEERLLQGDPAYRAYSEQVRWRLVPGIF